MIEDMEKRIQCLCLACPILNIINDQHIDRLIEIDEIIASLVTKKFLSIKPNERGIDFDIDAIFEFDPNQYEIIENKDIYEIAEDLLCRPLSASELQRLSDMLSIYGETKVTDALRSAEAYRKNNLAYVEAILKNEKM